MDRIIAQSNADEIAMNEVKRLLQKAKTAYKKAQDAENAVFQLLENMGIDLDAPTKAENADHLDEAVCCYLHYGEYTLAGLLSEIRTQCELNSEEVF